MQDKSVPAAPAIKRFALVLATIGVVGAAGAIALKHNQTEGAPQPAGAAPAALTPAALTPAALAPAALAPAGAAPVMIALPDFTQIVARNGPAVVNISVTGSSRTAFAAPQGEPGDDPFLEFFRRFQGPQGAQREAPTHGNGSGFIISADGIVLTNAHVVRDAAEVRVKLNDRREFRAKVLGSDPKTDVAVLKIEARNLPVLRIGNSNELKVGEWVLAIGSPYGLDSTVTAGVVSAKGRSLPDDSNVPFIQTDVAVNPGNSGGPLFNTRGEVVGINSQIYSRSGGYQGLSFAIPIDVAYRIKDQILRTGKATHAKLGVTIQEVNQGIADSFQLATPEGALVSSLEAGGPGEQAGLKPGDVIRKLNGQVIVASGDLPALIGLSTPGEKVTLELWRQGKPVRLVAKLGNASDRAAAVVAREGAKGSAKLGLALRPLAEQEMRRLGINAGLVIEDAAGTAADAGVQPGDVLLAVNGRPVGSIEQVRQIVARAEKSVALLILRGADKIFIPLQIG